MDYYDGKQLTEKEYKDLMKRGQQPHVDNKIKPKVRYLEGLEQQQRTDPRAFPERRGTRRTPTASRTACATSPRATTGTRPVAGSGRTS